MRNCAGQSEAYGFFEFHILRRGPMARSATMILGGAPGSRRPSVRNVADAEQTTSPSKQTA